MKSLTPLFVFHLPAPSPLLFRYVLTSSPSAIFIYFILSPLYFCAVCVRCHNLTLILPFRYSLRPFLLICVRALIRTSALARGMLPAPVTTPISFPLPDSPPSACLKKHQSARHSRLQMRPLTSVQMIHRAERQQGQVLHLRCEFFHTSSPL